MYTNLIKNQKGGAATKAILGIFISLALIVVILGGVFGYFWNSTPEKLKIADIEIVNGNTLRELGFAETKIKDIYKDFRALTKSDTSKVVQNKPDDGDKTDAENNFSGVEGGALTADGGGGADYSGLATGAVTYDKRYLQKWNDSSLAYVFNKIASDSVANGDKNNEGIAFLKSVNATVEEITVTRVEGENAEMRLVISVNTTSFKDMIKAKLGVLGDVIPVPDKIYAVSYLTLNADGDSPAKTSTASIDFKINDTQNALSQALLKLFASEAGAADNMTEAEEKAVINDKIGDAFESVLFNMGDLAVSNDYNAETGEITVASSIVYGATAINNGYIYLITRTAD